jgi:phosphoglycerate dehydrogenase-like enzyme
MFREKRIVIKGAGDLASGVAARLWRSGFPVIMTEIEHAPDGSKACFLFRCRL